MTGPFIESPLLKTTAYEEVHVQVPTFFKRQVLVKSSLGSRTVPSGMVTSSMNWATSQFWVGGGVVETALVFETASVEVGKFKVLVGGTVGGFRIAPWVILASTVWAAEVKTISAPTVGVTFEGRLQADEPNKRINKMEARRVIFGISLLRNESIAYLFILAGVGIPHFSYLIQELEPYLIGHTQFAEGYRSSCLIVSQAD